MKKFLLFAATVCLGVSYQASAQVAISQDFEASAVGALPSGWTTTGAVGWKTATGQATMAIWTLPAHTNYAIVNDNNATTVNNSAALTTPVFSLAGNNTAALIFDYWLEGAVLTAHPNAPEKGYVNISDDSGATWTTIDSIPPANLGNGVVPWKTMNVSLSGHTSANTVIQIVYNDGGLAIVGMAVDNIFIGSLPKADIAMVSTSLSTPYYPQNYAIQGGTLSFTGTVQNKGSQAISSFTIYTQVGTNAPTSTVIPASIASLATYNFSSSIPMPSATGSWNTHIWVTVDSDLNHANDSTMVGIGAYATNPPKKLSFEEGTGTWCGWCVRGIVFMDSLRKLYGETGPSLIAVHNGDPMTVASYDSYMTAHFYNSFPNVSIDRREIADPSALLGIAENEGSLFSFADVQIATPVMNGNVLTSNVTVTPATDLNGDYRLVLVVTEDGVNNAASTYAQHNYYAGGGYGAMAGFENLPSVIEADWMYFDHVARSITPSPTGAAGVLPSTMATGTPYTATLTATVAATDNLINLRTVVLLIRNSDGIVLNSASTTYWPVNVKTVAAGIDNVVIFPNPAQDNTTIKMTLNQSTNVHITIVDELGRTVSTVADQMMAVGAQTISVNTAALASGIYNVKIETAKGTTIQRLSVVK